MAQAAFAEVLVLSPESQGSPEKILALLLVTLIPYSLLSPFMGVFVDRWDRRRLMAGTNLIRALLLLTLPLWSRALEGDAPLFASVLILQGFGRLFLATKGAALPVVLHEHHLLQGNSLSGAGGTLSAVVGGAGGLLLVSKIDVNPTLVIAGVLYVLATIGAGRISSPMAHVHEHLGAVRHAAAEVTRELVRGLKEIWRRPRARIPLGAIFFLRSAGIFLAVVAILLIKREFPGEDQEFGRLGLSGLALGSAGAGALLAAIMAPRIGRERDEARLIVLGYALVGAGLIALGPLTGSIPALLALTFVTGAGGFLCKVSVDALVQEAMPDEFRGRAFSLYDILYNVASIIGGLGVVALGNTSLRMMFVVGGVVTLALGAIFLASLKRADLLAPEVQPLDV